MLTMHRHFTFVVVILCILFMGPVLASAQLNILSNPSFESGESPWTGSSGWGAVVTTNDAYDGTNVARFNAYGGNKYLRQAFPMSVQSVYEVDAWFKTVSGSDQFTPTSGYAMLRVQFFDASGALIVGNADSLRIGTNMTTSWMRYTTGPILAPAGTVTGKVSCYYVNGGDTTTNGFFLVDQIRAYTSTATRAGALYNPDFEMQPYGTLGSFPFWNSFGTAGVISDFARSGRASLQIYFTENMAYQTWVATAGAHYACSGYMLKTNGITTTNNAHGVILLQYLDSTGTNVLQTFESPYMAVTNSTNVWIFGEANGIAPVGTVIGRTMCAILGPDTGFVGSVFFDDISQRSLGSTDTVSGILHNPGFDDGASGNAYDLDLASALPYWKWLGWTNAGFVTGSYKYDSIQSFCVTWSSNMIAQRATAVTGRTYILEGYMSSPVGQVISNDAYGVFLMEFYSTSYKNGTSLVSVVESPHFTSNNTAGTWYKFSVTNTAPWTGSVTCRVLCAVMGPTTNYGGAVYFDGLTLIETNIPRANSQSGALWNPSFEYTANGTMFYAIDSWTNFGEAGIIDSTYTRTGNRAVKIYYPGQLLLQDWPATPSNRYASSAFVFTPSANRLEGMTNLHAVVLLQFFDSTGTNMLISYESPWFTTNAPADVWSNLEVVGVAPNHSAYGRTLIGLLATNTLSGFGGSLYFDDVTQRVVSTTGTVAGLLFNPGFEDGTPGNANVLSNDLPNWTWYGGETGGFVTTTYSYEGAQSVSIVYPSNLVGQRVAAVTGRTYVVEGYMSSPVGEQLSNTAYGVVYLQFFSTAYQGGTAVVSVVESAHLTRDDELGVWHKFAVTNWAPWTGSVTCRVMCAVMGPTEGAGGAVYFDGLTLTETNIPRSNTQSGALWNPSFEYTANGTVLGAIDSWTNLGFDGSVDAKYAQSGDHALKISYPETLAAQSWPATSSNKYASSAFAYTPSGDRLAGVSNLHGVVLLQFFDSTGTNLLISYESPWFTTNAPANVWSNLEVIGVAPNHSAYGRTVIGLLGTNTGFGGSLYFDDVTQRVVSTTGTVAGLLFNPGFDDGTPGNCNYLSNDLPHWTWAGGTNAGYIASDYKKDGQQALVITYPQNGVVQVIPCVSNHTYVASGYLFTPSTARFTSDGTSYGWLDMAFYVNGSYVTNYTSQKFTGTGSIPANQWTNFTVSGTAPDGTNVTAKLNCTIYSVNPGNDFEWGGVIYFDQLSFVDQAGDQPSEWAQWQIQNFGSTNGANTGFYEDKDLDGFQNWSEFIAGTEPTNNNSFLGITQVNRSGTNFLIRWPSVTGRHYGVHRGTNLVLNEFVTLTNNLAATWPENSHTDSPPASATLYYYRVSVTTNQP